MRCSCPGAGEGVGGRCSTATNISLYFCVSATELHTYIYSVCSTCFMVKKRGPLSPSDTLWIASRPTCLPNLRVCSSLTGTHPPLSSSTYPLQCAGGCGAVALPVVPALHMPPARSFTLLYPSLPSPLCVQVGVAQWPCRLILPCTSSASP